MRLQKFGKSLHENMMPKQGLEGMVVNILVHIECCEDVKRMTEIDFPWNDCITSEDWEKVCSTDDGHDLIVIAVEIRLNYPHAIVGVGVIKGFAKLVDEHA